MPQCERLAGITGLTIDGNAYMVVSDVTWSPQRWKRETLVGLDSVHGFSEVPIQGYIEATLRDQASISVERLQRDALRRGDGQPRQRQDRRRLEYVVRQRLRGARRGSDVPGAL